MMRYASANHADPYSDYPPYSDPYAYRDHHPRGDPSAGYRGHPSSLRDLPVPVYWETEDYRPPPTHHRSRGEHIAREPPAHYREPAPPTHRLPPPSSAPPPPQVDPSSAGNSAAGVPVGNITNSDDFASKDSRVFVGNLNTVALTKDDVHGIFGRLGHVTGISMHKGYAFVQFSSPGEARRALALENGQMYAGQALDLNIVSQPKIKGAPKMPGYDGNKRSQAMMEENMPLPGPPAKRPRPPELGNPSLQRGNLVTLANSDHPSYHTAGGSRKEPPELACAQCDEVFNSAWILCLHFQQRHHVNIFRIKMKRDGR